MATPDSGGGLQIRFKVGSLPSLRDEAGRFVAQGLTDQYSRNRRLAEVLSADVGRRIENHIAFGKRAGQSTGRLVRVSVDPRNTFSDAWRVGVGVESFLDRSTAKYWRTFEEGSAATWSRPFVGTQLFPVKSLGPGDAGLRTAPDGMDLGGRYIVKNEIAPAHIYRDVFASAHLQEEGIQAARRFLDRIFSQVIAGPPGS